jgi:hypothetical protein
MKIGTTSAPEKARRESVYMGTPDRAVIIGGRL